MKENITEHLSSSIDTLGSSLYVSAIVLLTPRITRFPHGSEDSFISFNRWNGFILLRTLTRKVIFRKTYYAHYSSEYQKSNHNVYIIEFCRTAAVELKWIL